MIARILAWLDRRIVARDPRCTRDKIPTRLAHGEFIALPHPADLTPSERSAGGTVR